ncbi:MAG: hypothetical protein Q8868_13575 [Bacteroidota bacterium]|nr:hypothetical protein [Bacteroidota bacterium]
MAMFKSEALSCVGEFVWVLKDAVVFRKPVLYKHPPGAITWVTLVEPTTKKVLTEASRSVSK